MATIENSFLRYKQKVEKNATNDGVSTDRGRFCTIFNESQNKFLELNLQQRKVDDVRYIQKFLILDKNISPTSNSYGKYIFPLPKDYFDLSDAYGIGSQKDCQNQRINLVETRTENITEIMQDEDNKPSFLWREAPYTVSSDAVNIYTDRIFSMDNLLLSYYRYPNQITLVNPYDPESDFNELVPIEWDDKSLDRIISICAGEFDMNESNQRFQLQKLRQTIN